MSRWVERMLRLARQMLMQVVNTINQQVNIVQEQVTEQITRFADQMLDDMWQGPDAEKFRSEVKGVVLPALNSIVDITTATASGLNNAAQTVEQGDKRVTQLVNELNNTFARIYR